MNKSTRLVTHGKSDYQIVIADNASAIINRAASQLRTCLKQISGVDIPVIMDDQPAGDHEILLGNNRHLPQSTMPVELTKQGDDGFAIFADGRHVSIVGVQDQGTLYGVYSFLEKYLGCRWYSSEVSYIPQCREITIDPINDIQAPQFKFREVYYFDAMESDFAERQKLNGNASIIQNGKLVEKGHTGWGSWCHTFFSCVPPEKYFRKHPEYFSLIDGKRNPDCELCLTNPDVLRITIDELRKWIIANPEARYWDVSQMDNKSPCQCPNCKAIDEREGTPMGSVLEFVNKIAAEFPDKIISTLAYQYTRQPPKHIKPADNVAIMLCSIECNRSKPISTDQSADHLNASFRSDLEGWAKICKKLFAWDYVYEGSNINFPNLRVLQPNIQLLAENGVQGVFAQGDRRPRGEWAYLRAYLLAKLLWDPGCDLNYHMHDFLNGFYGAAGKLIGRYIDLVHDELERSGKSLRRGYIEDHKNGYLSDKMIVEYDKIFDEAERIVGADTALLLRVQEARIPLIYAKLEFEIGDLASRKQAVKKLSVIVEAVGLNAFRRGEVSLPESIIVKNLQMKLCMGRVSFLPDQWHIFAPVDPFLKLDKSRLASLPACIDTPTGTIHPRIAKAVMGRLDLDPFIGGTGVSRCAYAFIPFALSEERHLVFGFGADYWFEAFLDGDPLYDTLECGNGPYAYYSSNNHVKAARLFKGRHLLAVRVLSGSGGWKLCAGIFTDLEAIK